MTDDEKVELAVEKLTAAQDAPPYPGRWLGDVFVYYDSTPDQDHDQQWGTIGAHRRADMIAWIDRAEAHARSVVHDDLWEALWEVEGPKPIDGQEVAHAR